jgi:DNA polymerase-3 subunit delta
LIVVAVKLDGRMKWTQALTKGAVTVNCAPLRDAQLSAWIRQEAAALGVRIHEEATQLLKEVGSESLYAVKRELEKLAAYVPPDRTVQLGGCRGVEGDGVRCIGVRSHERHRCA